MRQLIDCRVIVDKETNHLIKVGGIYLHIFHMGSLCQWDSVGAEKKLKFDPLEEKFLF